jgi:hypothetical protein
VEVAGQCHDLSQRGSSPGSRGLALAISGKTVPLLMCSVFGSERSVSPWRPGRPCSWWGLAALGLLPALGLISLPSHANPAPGGVSRASVPPGPCAAPQPGRYAVMGEGDLNGEPLARLLWETWTSDGTLKGVRLERRGRTYRESTYTGRIQPLSNCRVSVERTYLNTVSASQAVLDGQGRPRYSLGTLPDVLLLSRWFPQPATSCSATLLNGLVLSQQRGKSWRGERWLTNAVVQRERWREGQVRGLAISSLGPTVQEATYSGSIDVQPDCLATIRQRDSLGVTSTYRAIVLADGSGYLYLQTDPDEVTAAVLQRVASMAPPTSGL